MASESSSSIGSDTLRSLIAFPTIGPLTASPEAPVSAGRLPAALTSLIGRERDVAAVHHLLETERVRLLTLTGPGGVGKTRLALRCGEELHDDFDGDVMFLPLAAVADPDLFVPSVGAALNVREGSGRSMSEMVTEVLRERRTLLVLDNLEHLQSATPVLVRWLESCPRLTILATSRAMLHLSGERVYLVNPLPVPAAVTSGCTLQEVAKVDAVRLLLDRAQAVQPGFTLTEGNLHAISHICRAVDGLPLAIELAAARLRVLSPGELVAALAHQIDVLDDGPHDMPDRLRTMRNAIAWSVDRLSEDERATFRMLGAFSGGFTLQALDWVRRAAADIDPATCGQPRMTVSLIASMADKSLVQRVDMECDPPRFRLLEPIRAFAMEDLTAAGELASIRACHARWCLAFAEIAEPELSGIHQKLWFARVEAELPNLRAALQWFREQGDAERGLALASRLNWFWSSRGYYLEAEQWLNTFLSMTASDPVRGRGLLEVANILHWLGDHGRASACAKESVDLLHPDDPYLTMCAWRRLGSIAIDQGAFADARTYFAECHALMASRDETWEPSWAEWDEAFVVFLAGKLSAAAGQSEEALVQFKIAYEEFTRIGDHGYAAAALGRMGAEWIKRGDAIQARHALMTSLAQAIELGDRASIAWALLGAACLASDDGDEANATLLLHIGTGLREAVGELRTPISGFGHPLLVAAEIQQTSQPRPRAMANERDVARAIDLARSVLGTQHPNNVKDAGSGRPGLLTTREREVLELLAEGWGDKAIAVTLGMSRRTASKHVATILEKLEAESRTAAVTRAMRQGLLAAPSASAR